MGAPVVGLLGGVGSGKSTVARLLASRGARVIDADRIARDVLEEPDIRSGLRRRWGDAVMDSGGRPDRAALARLVFRDRRALRRLNRLVHPRVIARIRRILARWRGDPRPVVLDAPLLLETSLWRFCTLRVFVDAPATVRARRTTRGRGWTPREFARRERFQTGLARKCRLADARIDNGRGLGATSRQASLLYRFLCNDNSRMLPS
jgi:dephospho-CoA kinase